jgi:large subunit ribosomal protein L29
MSSVEIQERIDNEKIAYQKLKMNHVVSSLENPLKLKYARKTIARLSTELTRRAAQEGGVAADKTEAEKTNNIEKNNPQEMTKEAEGTEATE